MASQEEIRLGRINKIKILRDHGIDPYPVNSKRNVSVESVLSSFKNFLKTNKILIIAGRVVAVRGHGGAIFLDLTDGTGRIQAYLRKDEIGEKDFDLFIETVDVGDILEFKGRCILTKRREKTLRVINFRMLTKSLRALPDKWHGLQDIDERFRKRYLDLIMSPEVYQRFVTRSKVITEVRNFLIAADYLEVETPVLQPLAGGASALPFITHHNALNIDLYLRIAPELYLKKLLIAGFPKVFEVCRNFRNEGIDTTHNPEFAEVEFYESYSDAKKQRTFVEKLVKTVFKKVLKKSTTEYDGSLINLSNKFSVITYFDVLRRFALISNPESVSREDLLLRANQLGAETHSADSIEKIMDSIYKRVCRSKLIQPTFIVDYPINYLPLAKKLSGETKLVDAFQLVIGGVELAKAFSELNDPIDQAERFLVQDKNRLAGDKEAQPNDREFVEALEYGMPPAGGVGIGLDRLIMLLTNTKNIKEVIFFPTMRPKE